MEMSALISIEMSELEPDKAKFYENRTKKSAKFCSALTSPCAAILTLIGSI